MHLNCSAGFSLTAVSTIEAATAAQPEPESCFWPYAVDVGTKPGLG